jgi:uncharacterized protein YbbC (DUF1343 family)
MNMSLSAPLCACITLFLTLILPCSAQAISGRGLAAASQRPIAEATVSAMGERVVHTDTVGLFQPDQPLAGIEPLVLAEIRAGHIPGAVILVGQGDRILLRRAFGQRAVQPHPEAMTPDTIFDLASLTKAVFTTTAIMQLAEAGRLTLDTPVARYWPAFAQQGKGAITIRQLLAHTSGLADGIDLRGLHDQQGVLERLARVKPKAAAGLVVEYSDVNFAVLGELVRLLSGLSLPCYAREHLARPLHLTDTGFLPDPMKRSRIAPTNLDSEHLFRGQVHDPMARAMDGAGGHAGLFGTADDLAVFARTLLAGGGKLLSPSSVAQLFTLQTPANSQARGLGWRLDPCLAANRAALPPVGAASHLGFTGTALWLDPVIGVYVICLTNRLHPQGAGDAGPLRAKLISAVSLALGPVDPALISKRLPAQQALIAPYIPAATATPVRTGIDCLEADNFRALAGKRVALLTNRSGVDSRGRRTIDLLYQAKNLRLVALFSPEHGMGGDLEGAIKDTSDLVTGLPVYSLYGKNRRPRAQWLSGLDAVVVDLQDVGVRFYTYAATVGYLLEEAAKQRLPVYLLDRPNPIRADRVQGPILDPERTCFTAYWPLPVRHGMTLGELARLFVGEQGLTVDLQVVAMNNYRRDAWYDASGLAWLPPSPNLRDLAATTLYPGVGMIEGGEVSVGRGTDTPFQLVGAPWLDGRALAAELSRQGVAGVWFQATTFTPVTATYAGCLCQGVKIMVDDRERLDSPGLGMALAAALRRLGPDHFSLRRILGNVGSAEAVAGISAGKGVGEIMQGQEATMSRFLAIRRKYLLYPERTGL